MAGLTMVLEPSEVGLVITGRRWSFDVSGNGLFLAAFAVHSNVLISLESGLVNFHGFSRKQAENPKVFGQRSRQEENQIDHPRRLKLLWRYKLSSKTPISRISSASLPQSKRKHPAERESEDQILEIEPHRIKSIRSKGITQKQDQGSNVAQSILKQLMESLKAGIVLKENPLYDNCDSASSKSKKETHPDVMSIMMADITVEAAMVEIERKVNFLMKVVEERDHEITALREQMRTRETAESSQTPVVKAMIKDMIANSIRAQYRGPLQTSFMYFKSYIKRIDNLRMPLGYQPLKFQQFDGKGNPKHHIAHFVKTYENAGSRGDQLVKQFVRSLKGNAFEWYTDLEPEVIDS
ncbi:ty3-gypsy retrotransposon protein [Cucumis melo var. makuwa]|uniref:Ty3-gypsy retrotransposon protein n=1 Tax=Cucumis melo var. makuwa TaxID=1194695 RepID=A0A5D3BPV7_CUCMM|nr:ty3-gypsy retrotransposon protein [Cucumis melo var. makuwa]